MKNILILLLISIQSIIGHSQVYQYHIDGRYLFNHSKDIDTYTAFNTKSDVDMGSDSVNINIIFNHATMVIEFMDLMSNKTYRYRILSIDTSFNGMVVYNYFGEGLMKSFCVFQNTPTQRIILHSCEYNNLIYGWESVVK